MIIIDAPYLIHLIDFTGGAAVFDFSKRANLHVNIP